MKWLALKHFVNEQESALPLYKSSLSESLGSENVACMFIELG